MNKLQRYLLVGSILLTTLLPVAAFAQITNINNSSSGNANTTDAPNRIPTQFRSVGGIISTAFNVTIVLSGLVFVVLILLGGVQYLTSLGEEEGATKARKIIINGTIGLVIVLASYALGNYVLQLLCLNIDINSPAYTTNAQCR